MTLRARLMAIQNIALCIIRRWWRPLVQLGIGGSVVVNGVVLPLITRQWPDLTGLAALVVAASPFAAIRAWEKVKGTAE